MSHFGWEVKHQNQKGVQMPSTEAQKRTSTWITENLHKQNEAPTRWKKSRYQKKIWLPVSWWQQEMIGLILLWHFYSCFIILIGQKKSYNIFVHFSPPMICILVCFCLYAFSHFGKLFLCQNEFCFIFPQIKNICCDCFRSCLFFSSFNIYSPQKRTLDRKMKLWQLLRSSACMSPRGDTVYLLYSYTNST